MKKIALLPLLLLPVFFTLHRYMVYADMIPVRDALLVLAETIAETFLLFLLVRAWRKDEFKASLITVILMTFQLFFREWLSSLSAFLGGDQVIRYRIAIPVCVLLIYLSFRGILHAKNPARFTRYITIVLAAWILIDVATEWGKTKNSGNILLGISDRKITEKDLTALPPAIAKPDIYYLVFDCHPSPSALHAFGAPDTASLGNNLRSRGFQMAHEPRSNYHKTPLSMSATFNLGFIRNLRSGMKPQANVYTEAVHDVDNALVPNWFVRSGYRFVNLSMFRMAGKEPIFKEDFLALPPRNMLLYPTFTASVKRDLLWRFFSVTTPDMQTRVRRDLPLKMFNTTVQDSLHALINARREQPAFIYGHLYLPHPPYFYDAQGNEVKDDSAMDPRATRRKENLLAYITYTDNKMMQIVDEIRARDPEAVIIIQSDHGFGDLDMELPAQIKHMNITAMSLPGKTVQRLDGMSNINTFPVLVNTLFGLNWPLQPDSVIITAE